MFYAALEQTFILVQQPQDSGLMMRVVLSLVPVSRLLLQQGSEGHLTGESEIMEELRFIFTILRLLVISREGSEMNWTPECEGIMTLFL